MEKYDNDPSMADDTVHTSCCIKTESGGNSNVSAHELHRIKPERDIGTYMTDFNNPTSDIKSGVATTGLDIKSSVLWIKSEPQDYPPMQSDRNNAHQRGTEKTVVHPAGVMYMVNQDNQSSLQMCDDNQTDATHNTTLKGVCLKHEHIYCEDNTHQSVSPLNAADGDECGYTDDKPYKCIHCVKSFYRRDHLVKHGRLHSGDKPYKCDQCMKSFSNKSDLVKHVRVHTGDKPYKCDQCMKSFSVKGNLTKHIRVHTGDKPYKCDQCMKTFSDKSSLTKHIRVHTGDKPYKCEQCLKSFSEKSDLTRHITVHSGDTPYKCEQCMKSFSRKSSLTTHIGLHSGDKLHKCEQCMKAFSRKSSLTRHIMVHSGDTPYMCDQ
jgi:imidazoleglycerol phosphate dehydratase HisB